jgi:ABC-type bacteriocin/lantibiotic exporter with double-glycine peptidase domain
VRATLVAWLLAVSVLLAEAPAAICREPARWIDVPFVAQPRDGCGAASLSMVMQYWAGKQGIASGADGDVARIQHELYSPREHGIPAEAMGKYLRQHGFQAFAFPGKWSDLEEQIAKGRPLIVALRPQGQSELHYVVIDGVDSERGLVTMNDPADRKLLNEERARFEKEWSATHNWTLLAVPATASH